MQISDIPKIVLNEIAHFQPEADWAHYGDFDAGTRGYKLVWTDQANATPITETIYGRDEDGKIVELDDTLYEYHESYMVHMNGVDDLGRGIGSVRGITFTGLVPHKK